MLIKLCIPEQPIGTDAAYDPTEIVEYLACAHRTSLTFFTTKDLLISAPNPAKRIVRE